MFLSDKLPAPFPAVEDTVIFHDEQGRQHTAIITCVHGDLAFCESIKHIPCVNLVFASADDSKQDQYGRQIERRCSCVHRSNQTAHGNYWRWSTETANPVAAMQS